MNIRLHQGFAIIVMCVGLSACDKAAEKLSEKAVEKAIESQMEKDGNKSAKVSLGKEGIKTTVTDASGKVFTSEIGSAKVSEADVGVSFYPGAIMKDGRGTKITGPDGTVITVSLESKDDLEKVAEYYRSKMKSMAAGRQMSDMSQAGESATLVLMDEKARNSISVSVSKHSDDARLTSIAIMSSSEKELK